MAKSRSSLSSDIFDDAQTEFADPLLADAGGVPMSGAPSVGVQDGGLQAPADSALVLSSVEHHASPDDPGASTINASGGTGVTNAGQPVGTIAQLADYLVNGVLDLG